MENPTAARTEITKEAEETAPIENPSERSSETVKPEGKSDLAHEGKADRKPSVRKKLEEIKRERSKRAKDRPKAPEILKEKGSMGSKPKER